jgi:hypothetical protein
MDWLQWLDRLTVDPAWLLVLAAFGAVCALICFVLALAWLLNVATALVELAIVYLLWLGGMKCNLCGGVGYTSTSGRGGSIEDHRCLPCGGRGWPFGGLG